MVHFWTWCYPTAQIEVEGYFRNSSEPLTTGYNLEAKSTICSSRFLVGANYWLLSPYVLRMGLNILGPPVHLYATKSRRHGVLYVLGVKPAYTGTEIHLAEREWLYRANKRSKMFGIRFCPFNLVRTPQPWEGRKTSSAKGLCDIQSFKTTLRSVQCEWPLRRLRLTLPAIPRH